MELTDTISVGSKVSLEVDSDRNPNLDRSNNDSETEVTPSFAFAVAFEPNKLIKLFIDLELERGFFLERPDDRDDRKIELKIEQVYLLLRDALPGFSLQIG